MKALHFNLVYQIENHPKNVQGQILMCRDVKNQSYIQRVRCVLTILAKPQLPA
jgi:hypothetical protein